MRDRRKNKSVVEQEPVVYTGQGVGPRLRKERGFQSVVKVCICGIERKGEGVGCRRALITYFAIGAHLHLCTALLANTT